MEYEAGRRQEKYVCRPERNALDSCVNSSHRIGSGYFPNAGLFLDYGCLSQSSVIAVCDHTGPHGDPLYGTGVPGFTGSNSFNLAGAG
jgi:hypothetical protein